MPETPPNRLELERLQARYEQAPQSRLFAPLADAYRAAGRGDEALRLLEGGLQRHPQYVSAWVLLGQCYLDLKQDERAESCFARVLELDPENLLALRYRADRARRRGALERAVELLRRLLEIDPFDREVQADLGLVATALERKARAGGVDAPADATPMPWQAEDVARRRGLVPHVESPLFEPSAPAAASYGVPEQPGDPASAPQPGSPPHSDLEPPPIDLKRVGMRGAAAGEAPPASRGGAFAVPRRPPEPSPDSAPESPRGPIERAVQDAGRDTEWQVTRQDDRIVVSPGDAPPRGPIRSVETRLWTEQRPSPGGAPASPTSRPITPVPPAPPASVPPAPPSAPPADEFATLTLARIYESQGYLEKALAIYDELHRKHPEHRETTERLASLQRRLAGLVDENPPSSIGPSPVAPTVAAPSPETESRVEWRLLDTGNAGESAAETARRLREVTDDVRAQERARRHTVIGSPPDASVPAAPLPPELPEPAPEIDDDVTRPDFKRFLNYVRSLKREE